MNKIISIFKLLQCVHSGINKMNTKKFKVDGNGSNNDERINSKAKYLKPNLVIINNDKMFMPLKKSLEGYSIDIVQIMMLLLKHQIEK